jgi:hypothetical protein
VPVLVALEDLAPGDAIRVVIAWAVDRTVSASTRAWLRVGLGLALLLSFLTGRLTTLVGLLHR